MESIGDLIKDPKKFADDLKSRHKYVTKEFQDFGYRLAVKLADTQHASMYIKMAKERERALLEQALSFTIDYPNANSKPRIFLWKLRELQEERNKALGIDPKAKKKKSKNKKKTKKPIKKKVSKRKSSSKSKTTNQETKTIVNGNSPTKGKKNKSIKKTNKKQHNSKVPDEQIRFA